MNTLRKTVATGIKDEKKNTFSLMTYNILADCHVKGLEQSSYPFVKVEWLLKEDGLASKRHLLTMKELNHFSCDIMLLQEVEGWYSSLLQTELQKSGYEYAFLQKVGVPEGCAICYKTDKFQCIETRRFCVHDQVIKISKIEGMSDALISEIERPNVAMIVVLRDIRTGKYIICANTHIIYDGFADPSLQALQACLVSQKVHKEREEIASSFAINSKDIAIIFGGDFNGEPDHMSIKLMKNGKLTDDEMKTLENLTYVVREKKAQPTKSLDVCHVSKYLSKYLENPLSFSSVFCDVIGNEPIVTSSEASYVGCLDYIFYTPDLEVASTVNIDQEVGDIFAKGGPTEQFASDHLPLIAEFIY